MNRLLKERLIGHNSALSLSLQRALRYCCLFQFNILARSPLVDGIGLAPLNSLPFVFGVSAIFIKTLVHLPVIILE